MIFRKFSDQEYKAFKEIVCVDGDFSLVKVLGLKALLQGKVDRPVEVQKELMEVI